MKKQLLNLSFFLAVSTFSYGQVTLEQSYVSGGPNSGDSPAFKKSDNSLFYYTFNSSTNEFSIYDGQHLLVRKFTAPIGSGNKLSQINIIADHLINSDNSIEFICSLYGNSQNKVIIFNDEGNLLHTFNDKNIVYLDKTASNTYKLIVSDTSNNPTTEIPYYHRKFDVYSLTGTLSSAQEEIYNNFKSFAYPNPAMETLNISVDTNTSDYVDVEVYDLSGKKVINEKIKIFNNQVVLNISSLSKGSYVYKIGKDSKQFIKN